MILESPKGLIDIPRHRGSSLEVGISSVRRTALVALVKESSWEGERPGSNQLGAKPTDPECARQAQNCWMRERSSGSTLEGISLTQRHLKQIIMIN